MDASAQAAIDAVRSQITIKSVVRKNGAVIVTVRDQFELARIPGETRMKRTGWEHYPAMVYKWFDGVKFRCFLKAVPDELKNRSVEVV